MLDQGRHKEVRNRRSKWVYASNWMIDHPNGCPTGSEKLRKEKSVSKGY